MNLDVTEPGKISCQFPDVWMSLYRAGMKVEDGKEEHYRGALVIRRGTESIHLNALDIVDLFRFFDDERVKELRKVMSKEHTATNLLRALVMEATL